MLKSYEKQLLLQWINKKNKAMISMTFVNIKKDKITIPVILMTLIK